MTCLAFRRHAVLNVQESTQRSLICKQERKLLYTLHPVSVNVYNTDRANGWAYNRKFNIEIDY